MNIQSIYKKLRLDVIFNTSTFIGNAVIALSLTIIFAGLGYGEAMNYVFFLTVLSIGLWVTEAIPPFAVGIFIVAMMLLGFGTDYIIEESYPVDIYVDTWTSNVVWLLMGGFFLAKGMSNVGLDRALFRFTISRFGAGPRVLLLGLMYTTALASMVMSNTATTTMMISSVVPLVLVMGKDAPFSRALMTGIPAAATVGGVGTIIGSTPNAIAVGALNEAGFHINFASWMAVGFPMSILLVWLLWKFFVRRFGLDDAPVDVSLISEKSVPGNLLGRNAVLITLVLTVGLWMTEPLHGIPVAATSAVPIVLLTLTKVVTAEHVRTLPWDTLMLVAGGLALGIALVQVGLAGIVMEEVKALPLPVWGVAILFAFIAVLVSNVMSNTAAASILVPLAIALPGTWGFSVPVIVALSCSCALLLPVSTPSNAVSFATGLVDQKEFRPGGLLLIVAAPLLSIVSVLIWIRLVL